MPDAPPLTVKKLAAALSVVIKEKEAGEGSMSILERIDQDLLIAVKGRDEIGRTVLRGLKSSIHNSAIEQGTPELSDEEIERVIAREIKRRKESIEAYQQANKPELAEDEKAELEVLGKYLPDQMSEEQLRAHIENYLEKNPTDKSQMGKVMGTLSQELRGKADMGLVSRITNELLNRQ